MQFFLRKALSGDVKLIHSCLMTGSSAALLLPRSLSNIYNHVRDFYVAEDEEGRFAGCCALAVIWEDLAEIRSLYVHETARGNGLGRRLVEMCIEEGRALGMRRIFTLTYQVDFFARLNFGEVGKDVLPQKIWADCIHCPKFPDCDEIAMLKEIDV